MKTRRKRLRVNGKVVREGRERRGWTLDQAAAKIGISRQGLYYIEEGFVRYPHRLTLRQISTRLGIRMKEIAS
jgi:transcriptional regulator with XRE-family HTH domain